MLSLPKRQTSFYPGIRCWHPQRYMVLPLVAAFVCAAAWAIYVHFKVRPLPYDDGFITYRYVENALAGKGLVYNDGQRVFGSTTPLFTMLLILVRAIVPEPTPQLAVHLNAMAFIACGIGVYEIVRKLTTSRYLGAFGAIVFLMDPAQLVTSTGGMESHLFLALILGSLALLMECSHPVPTAIVIGLAILTRPEGVLLVPLLAWEFRRSIRSLLGGLAALLLTLLPWGIFSSLYYGSPVPLSLVAKAKPVYPVPRWDALDQLVHRLGAWTTGETMGVGYFGVSPSLPYRPAVVLLVCASIALLLTLVFEKNRAWIPVGFFWLLLGTYAVGNPLVFDWYLPVFFAMALVILLAGFHAAGKLANRWLKTQLSHPKLSQIAAGVSVCFILIWLIATSVTRYSHSPWGLRAPIEDAAHDPSRLRILAYRQAAEELNARVAADCVIGASEIGSFGYYAKTRILDFCGLISPEVHPYLPVPAEERFGPSWGAIGTAMVRATIPDYIVTLPVFAVPSLGRSEWFAKNYALINRVPLPATCWASEEVLIFRRNH